MFSGINIRIAAIIAKCLIARKGKIVPVRVANINEDKVTLKKGQTIGTCEPVIRITKVEKNLRSSHKYVLSREFFKVYEDFGTPFKRGNELSIGVLK